MPDPSRRATDGDRDGEAGRMKLLGRRTTTPARPPVTGTLRVVGSVESGLPELAPGDVLVVDVTDLSLQSAEAIAAAPAGAVVNAGRLTVGRYASLGPRALADAGVVWVDEVGRTAVAELVDGATVRLDRGAIHLLPPGDVRGEHASAPVAVGRELDLTALGGPDRTALSAPVVTDPPEQPAPSPPPPDHVAAPRATTPSRTGEGPVWVRRLGLLGLGIAVGALVGASLAVVLDDPQTTVVDRGSSAADVRAREEAEAGERSAQDLVSAIGPRVYGTGLAGHGVAVIGLPGVRSADVSLVTDEIRTAGGVASRTVGLRGALLDPAREAQVDQVGAQLAAELADPRVDPAAATYVRLGQLLAVATTTTRPVSAVPDAGAITVRDALASAGLAGFPNGVRLAPLVLLVLPAGDRDSSAQTELLAGLIDGLATTAAAVVVVGDDTSAQSGGALATLRTHTLADRVSTVDGVDQPTGRVSLVLALEAALTGVTGAYGAAGADGPVPGA